LQIDLYVAAAGLLVGFTVGLTGMGGGALMTPLLVLLFKVQPLAAVSSDLVGTDLVQAIPLVASAAAGHLLFGDFKLGLTASLLVGSIPGVYLGAKLSSRANDAIIRPALALILIASGLKLLGVDNLQLGLLVLGLVLLAIPLWGALDATLHPEPAWARGAGRPAHGGRGAAGRCAARPGLPGRAGLLRTAAATADRGDAGRAHAQRTGGPEPAAGLNSNLGPHPYQGSAPGLVSQDGTCDLGERCTAGDRW
jgi:hypothetical protein